MIRALGPAREALKQIQLFWCLDDTEIEVKRLGGLTNLVFFVNLYGEQYVLRIPGKGTEEYINRRNEAQAAREAAKAKVSPDVLHFDEKTGVMVTRFIDQASPCRRRISKPAKARPNGQARHSRSFIHRGPSSIFALNCLR